MASRDWCTLNDRVIKLRFENQTETTEYQYYLQTFGRDKIESMWNEHVRKISSAKNWVDPGDPNPWTLFSPKELSQIDPSLIQEYGGSLPDGSKYIRLRESRSA